jgi:hypothetical protein
MSLVTDLRSYADKYAEKATQTATGAVNQGRQTLGSAQAQLGDLTQTATGAVTTLRESAEKAVNYDALRSAVGPYVTQVKGYGETVADRAEAIVEQLRKDPRFGTVVDSVVGTATSVSGAVVGQVQTRVVTPLQSLTRRGGETATSSSAARAPRKPAATKPATGKPSNSTPKAKSSTPKPARKTSAGRSTSTPTTARGTSTVKADTKAATTADSATGAS